MSSAVTGLILYEHHECRGTLSDHDTSGQCTQTARRELFVPRTCTTSLCTWCVWVLQRDVALAEITKAVKRPPVPVEAYSLRATLHYNSGHYV